MRIPPRYEKANYLDVPGSIREKFEEIPKTRKGMYIHGRVGCGKTHVAYSLIKRLGQEDGMGGTRYNARFWNMTELIHAIKRDFDLSPSEKYHHEDDLMGYQGILFLDDLGAEKPTEFVAETIYLIINKRYNDMKPTIITSNFALEDLSDRVGERIASRIGEMCEIFELDGKDRRLQ